MDIVSANIGNALHSVAPDHVVAVAEDIYDKEKGKYQSQINNDNVARIEVAEAKFGEAQRISTEVAELGESIEKAASDAKADASEARNSADSANSNLNTIRQEIQEMSELETTDPALISKVASNTADIESVSGQVMEKVDEKPTGNIFNAKYAIEGKYINSAGAEATNASYAASQFIRVNATRGTIYVCSLKCSGVGGSYIAQYDSTKTVIAGKITNTAEYVTVGGVWWYVYTIQLASNCKYVRFGCDKTNVEKFMVCYEWNGNETELKDFNAIGGYVEGMTSRAEQIALEALNVANDRVEKKIGNNLFDKSNIKTGYFLNSQGKEQANAAFFCSDYIPVSEAASLAIEGSNAGGGFTWLYDENKNPLNGVYQQTGYAKGMYMYTPEWDDDAKYIRFSCGTANKDKCAVVYGSEAPSVIEEYSALDGYIKPIEAKILKAANSKTFGFELRKNTLTAGQEMILRVPNIQSEFVETFYAKVNNATGIDFCVDTQCAIAEITATQIKLTGTSVQNLGLQEKVYTHGLTIKDYVCVTIVHGYELGVAKITLSSGGADYTINDAPWYGTLYRCHANVIAGSLKDIILSYHPTGMKKPVWMYGDSYFGIWTKYLIGKFDNYMLDAYYGVSASVALDSLKRALAVTQPAKIVWCQGMNNWESAWQGHDESYQQWEDSTKEVMALCEAYGIELILCTIPSTATHSNARKNQFVTESGYRYIDVNNAVGDGNGTWFTGYLASDDIHPTDLGSKAIASVVSATLYDLL